MIHVATGSLESATHDAIIQHVIVFEQPLNIIKDEKNKAVIIINRSDAMMLHELLGEALGCSTPGMPCCNCYEYGEEHGIEMGREIN